MGDVSQADVMVSIRHAEAADAALVLDYMKRLGVFQKMEEKITATEPQILRLLEEGAGEAVFAQIEGETLGFMYFCAKSSAFSGRSGLYLDAFYVDAQARGKGVGRRMMGYLSRLARERGGSFLEWGCMDWNAEAIAFYRGLGAYSLDEMTVFRFAPDVVERSADLFDAKGEK